MSHSFIDNDQGYDASPKVYVNNMNTRHATVGLPNQRPKNNNNKDTWLLLRGNDGLTDNAEFAGVGRNAGSRLTSDRKPSTSNGGAQVAWNRAGVPTTAQGEAVHPNLQDVYSRIMRRLQRQMNYAELPRTSLAEQYGVDLELQCEAEEAVAAATTTSQQGDGGYREGHGAGPPRSNSISDNNNGSSSSATAAGPLSALSSTQVPLALADTELDALREDTQLNSKSLSQPASRSRRSNNSNNSRRGGGAAAARAGVGAGGTELNGMPSKDGGPHGGGGGGGAKSTSRLLQFKQRPLPTSGDAGDAFEDGDGTTTSGTSCGGARSDADVEREIAEEPCPRPLRLVVQHVIDTLEKKMTLAESGSLRDCIVFSFESRALLDRLLREIPLYTQYTAFENKGGTGSNGVTQAVSGVYQQLRKRPVLLPRGEYVEDAATGAIRAELVSDTNGGFNHSHEDVSSSFAAAATHLPSINVLPTPSLIPCASNADYNGDAQTTPLPEVVLPVGYGKSSRLTASAARNNANHNASPLSANSRSNAFGVRGGSATTTGGGSDCGGPLQHQNSFHYSILRDHLSAANASVPLAADSHGDVSEFTPSECAERQPRHHGGGGSAGEANVPFTAEAAAATAAAHRATQLVSVGTITEENGVTTVPEAEYAALKQQMQELQTQLADAQQHRSALAEQLCEEAQYTDQKKRIIQYLRETLVRECNMLRTQLRHAAGATAAAAATTTTTTASPAPGKSCLYTSRSALGSGVSNAVFFKEASTALGGLNASTHSYARMHKQSNGAARAAPTLMGTPTLQQQQQPLPKITFDHPDESESLGSVYGGNYGVTMSGAGDGGGGGRPFPQPHHSGVGNNNNNNLSIGGGIHGSLGFSTSVWKVEAVESLLDLALLAVEDEAVLPPNAAQQLQSGHGDKELLRSGFRKNAKQQLDELRVDFEEREQALKKALLQQTAEHNYVVAELQAEVKRLRALTDTTYVRNTLQAGVSQIRAELTRVRMHVAEQLHFFRAVLHSSGQGLLHRAALVDSTMSDNVALTSTLNALKESIESANTLFLPMLTREYECGYHPWPLKERNTRDPLGHIVQLRFGSAEVVRLRDSLTEFGRLYVAVHQYVMGHAVLPESARPTTGRPLEQLCAALALNPTSHTDVVFAARRCHDVEGQLRRKLARLQSRILWNAYQQRTYRERSMAALTEAGIDPRVTTLPVARCIDVLAQERGDLLQARVKVQRERSENAKELYRLWREKGIDIMEGYPTPQTQRNRLALLSSSSSSAAAGGEDGVAIKRTSRTPRFSLALKQGQEADGIGAAGSINF